VANLVIFRRIVPHIQRRTRDNNGFSSRTGASSAEELAIKLNNAVSILFVPIVVALITSSSVKRWVKPALEAIPSRLAVRIASIPQ
jgi:hypothetical protein